MVGQNIGKYRVLDRVGRGGMGTVYRAIDETLHREVAIKVLNAELNDPEVAKRFRAEAITVARLSHPGIATIYELFQHEGQWLMVMEFVRGETLERMVERLGALPADRAAELCMQSLAALAHAHSMGVVHRDLKPANIMVTESGTVKIMDFGIARVAGTEHLTNVGFMMGTPAYMAPEQVLGQEIDARADIYAMGVVFYRLLTGQLPFKGETPFAMAQAQVNNPPTPVRTIRADLPPWVDEVMARSLAKKPDDRFPSAVAFHEGFSRCLAGMPISTDYSSSAPTGLISTPPRAMPTGTIERAATPTSGTASNAVPPAAASQSVPVAVAVDLSAMAPTMAGTPISTARPPTETMLAADLPATEAPTMQTSTPPVAAVREPPARSRDGAKKGGSIALLAGAAGLVVLAGVAGMFWVHTHRAAPPEATAAPEPAPVVAPAPPPATPAAPLVAPPTPAPVPAAPVPAAAPPAASDAASSTAGPARSTAAADASTSDAGRRGGGAGRGGPARGPVDDSAASFDGKVLAVTGKKSKDDDATLKFGAGQVAIARKKDDSVVIAWPYKAVAHATYVKARDPQWDSSFASPPDDLDVGGVLRTSKHWFVLQNKDAYVIFRLSDGDDAPHVIDMIEARTGLTVAQPKSDPDKK